MKYMAIIEADEKPVSCEFIGCNGNVAPYLIGATNNIKAFEQEPRWIPVSERLPKAGEYIEGVAKYYLVQNEYGDMLVARYPNGGYWQQIYQMKPIDDEIVAWMPLPEPYKAESEET